MKKLFLLLPVLFLAGCYREENLTGLNLHQLELKRYQCDTHYLNGSPSPRQIYECNKLFKEEEKGGSE